MTHARPYPAQILALKAFKALNDYSANDVVDVCAAEGQITNISTVKRIFRPGSEALNFNYVNTLEPIIYAFNRRGANIPEPDLSESIKGTSAAELEQALEAMERVHKSEIERRDQELEHCKAQLKSERRQKYAAVILCVASLIYELTLFALRS